MKNYRQPKKKTGSGFGKFLIFLLVLAMGGFGYVMYRFNDSPQRAWKRIAVCFQQLTSPAPILQPKPAPTPLPTPVATPEITPIPTPESTPEPTPSATPTPPPTPNVDPVAFLIEHPDAWPKEVRLLVPSRFSMFEDGVEKGVIDVPVGTKLVVQKIEPGFITVRLVSAFRRLPIASTDLAALAPEAMQVYWNRHHLKESLLAGARMEKPQNSPVPVKAGTVRVPGAVFVHPGGLHTKADLDRMKEKVAAGEHPWIDGWKLFCEDRKAQETWRPAPNANMSSRQRAQDDATAMYYNALRWYISRDRKYAECAVNIANRWSSTLKEGPAGDFLSGIPVGSFALAGEVLRAYPGWAPADFQRFKKMLLDYGYPKCNVFLTTHGGNSPSRSWANWDACNMVAVLGIGVLCDDEAKFDQAVEYFKSGAGMGAIKNAVPFVYPGGLGQWQESGRDHAHAMGGLGLLSEFCQVAWNQGVDLFGYDDNRLLAGAEYEAQYNLWKGVPYTFYTNSDRANQSYISTNYHGRLQASHYELLYNHYVVTKGLKAPNVKLFAEMKRPEDGNVDVFGYGTLTFTLDAKASPYPAVEVPPIPQNLRARAGLGRIELKWSPSGAYTTQGYEVFRATSGDGPFESISSTRGWTTPEYTDTVVENGKTYFYMVSALNDTGASGRSEAVNAKPMEGGPLPKRWASAGIGSAKDARGDVYAEVANNTFVMKVAGNGIGGDSDNCHYLYQEVTGNFTITSRLIGRNGMVVKVGLMIRESLDTSSKMVAITIGERGGRETRFGTRSAKGENMTTQFGNDYTWQPAWFRIQRKGNNFTAFQSSDGITWFQIGESKVTMSSKYLIGMAAANGETSDASASASFDNVTVEEAPPSPPEAPLALKAKATSGSSIQLNWTNPDSNRSGIKIEASVDNELFYEIADLPAGSTSFVNTGVTHATGHFYRVRAYNTGGYSAYTNSAGIAAPPEFKTVQ